MAQKQMLMVMKRLLPALLAVVVCCRCRSSTLGLARTGRVSGSRSRSGAGSTQSQASFTLTSRTAPGATK